MVIKGLDDHLVAFKDGKISIEELDAEIKKLLPGEFIPKEKYNNLAESKKLAEENASKLTVQLEELTKKAGLSDEYKAKVESLTKEIEASTKKHAEELYKRDLTNAIDNQLRNAKARDLRAVKAVMNLDGVKLEGDKILGLDQVLEKAQKDFSYLFESTDEQTGSSNNPVPKFGQSSSSTIGSGENDFRNRIFAAAGIAEQKL